MAPVPARATGGREGGNGPALLFFSAGVLAVFLLSAPGCESRPSPAPAPSAVAAREAPPAVRPADVRSARWTPLLDDVEKRTFDFFWERANPNNGLVPDRWPSRSFSSIAAVGFALT